MAALTDAGTPLWPQRFSRELLEARRAEIGARAFAQEYMNQPVSLEARVFDDGDWRLYDPALLSCDTQWHYGGRPLAVAIGVDPAIGQGEDSDYFAAVVVGISVGTPLMASAVPDAINRVPTADSTSAVPTAIYVLHISRIRAPFAQQLAELERLAARWLPRRIGIEAVAYQMALAQAALDNGLPVVAMKETRAKVLRIEAMAAHASAGRVLLPSASAWGTALRQEAAQYPAGAHDDQLDALARAIEVALPLCGSGDAAAAGLARRTLGGVEFAGRLKMDRF